MTQDREELKRLAEGARDELHANIRTSRLLQKDDKLCRFQMVAHPKAILSLLSDLEAMQEALNEAEAENTRWLLRFDDIREASGVGALPMLSDLPAAIKAKIDQAIPKEPEA